MLDDSGYMNENEYDDVDAMLGDPAPESEQPAEKKKNPRPKGMGKYIFLALLFVLLSLGGLFIGFIGGFFKHPLLSVQSGIDATVLGAFINLISKFGEVFDNITKAFAGDEALGIAGSISGGINTCIGYLVYLIPVLFALISLILFIVSLATRKPERARTCAYASGILTLLAYGAIFLYTFAVLSATPLVDIVSGELSFRPLSEVLDYSCLAVAGVCFIVLFIASCVRSKRTGFLNALALLFTAVCALAVYYPGTITSLPSLMAFDLAEGSMLFFGIAFPALIIILVFNLIFSSARLNAKKGITFDTVRYALQLIALLLTVIATICYPLGEDRWAIFKDTQLIATVILLALSIACLFIPLFTLVYRGVKRRGEKQSAAAATQYQGDTAQDASYSGYDFTEGYDNGYQNSYAQPQASAPQEQPQSDYAPPQPENNYQSYNAYQEPAPAPAPESYNYQAQQSEAEDVVVTIDTDDLQNFFNQQQPPEPQPEPQPEPETLRYQAPEPEPEVLSSHEPVVIKEVIREVIKEKEPDPAPKPELTEFERRMAALARSNDAPKEAPPRQEQEKPSQQRPRQNPQQQNGFRQNYRQGFNGGPAQPNRQNNSFLRQNQQTEQPFAGRGNEQGRAEPNYNVPAFAGNRQPNSYVFGGAQYTYDPFINTLTPMEKNEFGDVFIANLYGIHSYLPTYVIGGDNTEFFQTIFIHLGRFRGNISQELMEKIYSYVSKM